MADDVLVDNGTEADFTVATDDVGGKHYQRFKMDLGGDGASSPLVRGQQTGANSMPVVVASDQTITTDDVQYTEGDTDATITGTAVLWEDTADTLRSVSAAKPLPVNIVAGGGSGGTALADDADFTPLTTNLTPVGGAYESSPTSVTDGDIGMIGIDQNRRVKVTVDASTIDVAHDAADSGNPVLIGMRAQNALPAAVANSDRARAISDLFGRQLVSHIDPAQFIWKQVEATTQQTGTTIWQPTSGKKIAVTGYEIGTGGTTAALVTLWFGDNADTTFTQGTDQVLFRGSLTPTSTSTPGVISNFASPVFCTTANRELHYTTSAGITVYITVYGYEF